MTSRAPRLPRARLLSATQVARCCGVDIKTIHNWANKGKIPHDRTAGRHLRFRPLDVVDFLRSFEMGLPDWLRGIRLVAVVVDTDTQTLTAARRSLARRFDVVVCGHAVDALIAVGIHLPDVLIVGNAAPLDAAVLAARVGACDETRHVRVVALADAHRLRETLEALTS
jgi:hypothetical protein